MVKGKVEDVLVVATHGGSNAGAYVHVLSAKTLTPIFTTPVSTTNVCRGRGCLGVTSTPVITPSPEPTLY